MQRTWCHRNAHPLTLNAYACRPATSPASSMSHSRMLRTNDCRRKPRPAIGPEKKRFHPWTSIASERPRGAAEQQEPPGPPDDSPITKSLSQRREGAHPTLPPAPCLLTQPTGLCSSRQGRAVAMATGGSPQLGGVTKGYGGISYLPAPDALGRSGGALEGELFSAVAIDSEERRLQVGEGAPRRRRRRGAGRAVRPPGPGSDAPEAPPLAVPVPAEAVPRRDDDGEGVRAVPVRGGPAVAVPALEEGDVPGDGHEDLDAAAVRSAEEPGEEPGVRCVRGRSGAGRAGLTGKQQQQRRRSWG